MLITAKNEHSKTFFHTDSSYDVPEIRTFAKK